MYPIVLAFVEWLVRDHLLLKLAGVPLLAWGVLQFILSGRYRNRLGGGGPGMRIPPERLVTTGIYAYTRNPMYLSFMIYMAGLAIALSSWIGAVVLLLHIPWFNKRAVHDEQRLQTLFGDEYEAYRQRVKRWIPGVI